MDYNANYSYHELVNMLLQNITPEYRSSILNKLVSYNNQLMISQSQYDPARSGLLNSRKKDVNELQHPSTYNNNRFSNQQMPMPLTLPMRASSSYPVQPAKSTARPPIKFMEENVQGEIDIDDIINDFSPQETPQTESMEAKLRKLDTLHKKIIADKRQRRKNKNASIL
jgi:hypothetical protein